MMSGSLGVASRLFVLEAPTAVGILGMIPE